MKGDVHKQPMSDYEMKYGPANTVTIDMWHEAHIENSHHRCRHKYHQRHENLKINSIEYLFADYFNPFSIYRSILQRTTFKNVVTKDGFADNKQFLLLPQSFQ